MRLWLHVEIQDWNSEMRLWLHVEIQAWNFGLVEIQPGQDECRRM